MENLRDKMLKVIAETTFEVDERLAEACARVAEEEIAKAFDAGERFANECFCGECSYCLLDSDKAPDKDVYLKSLK